MYMVLFIDAYGNAQCVGRFDNYALAKSYAAYYQGRVVNTPAIIE